ncbi:Two-component sensor histidine kinase OS=Streptomyces microflavus OX=1919 GN=Smic_56290 PE=4 SV=1 [Streptomyces microflavus]
MMLGGDLATGLPDGGWEVTAILPVTFPAATTAAATATKATATPTATTEDAP